eukprot:TRINITY_DN263_c0_g1_i1.p1 TRINITY_DN263_c0_g1~~TRINITY_DN263_c0_g1_i1.p1  ORF type:complete len:435 (+),score=83.20 TRINITY_DN263_c0_g1_i1:50-1354(+)
MSRLPIVAALCLALAVSSCFGEHIFWSPKGAEALPSHLRDVASIREIANGALAIFPDNSRSDLISYGFDPVPALTFGEPYLVQFESEEARMSFRYRMPMVYELPDNFAILYLTHHDLCALIHSNNRRNPEKIEYVAPVRPTLLNYAIHNVDRATKDQLVNAVSKADFDLFAQQLSGAASFTLRGQVYTNDNRNTNRPGNALAAEYIADRFKSFGYSDVQYQNFTVSGTPTSNVIAVKRGSRYPDEIVVIGAHFDSTSENTAKSAPGAEDNGSGTSAVLAIAKAFASSNSERTIHFIAFSGEEQGLLGSAYYVSKADKTKVLNALTMDMVSYWKSRRGILIEGTRQFASLMSVVETNVKAYTRLTVDLSYSSFGSDHVSFQRAGIPAILGIDLDWGSYPDYHRTTDTYDKLDTTLGHEISKSMMGALVDLAGVSA